MTLALALKTCTKCGETKQEHLFGARAAGKNGLMSACKDCMNKYERSKSRHRAAEHAAYRAAHPEIVAAHQATYQKSRCVVTCIQCAQSFTKILDNERGRIRRGKLGPFCSHSCAGRFLYKTNRSVPPRTFPDHAPKRCDGCGCEFHPRHVYSKYHNHACYEASRRAAASPAPAPVPMSMLDMALTEALG